MFGVLGACNPFEVAGTIILPIFVFVIYLNGIRGRFFEECFGDDSMGEFDEHFTIVGEPNVSVSTIMV